MIEITEVKTEYSIKNTDDNLEIHGEVEKDGKITIRPHNGKRSDSFKFHRSGVMTTLKIIEMMTGFVKMVKNEQGENDG